MSSTPVSRFPAAVGGPTATAAGVSPLVSDPVASPVYTVQLLGFKERESTLFASVFNLSRSRAMRYVQFDLNAHPHADYYIIDTADRSALDAFVMIDPDSYGGALFVGEAPVASDHAIVKRPIRWAEVLLRLDELPRPAHPAQIAALVAAGLVAPEQATSGTAAPMPMSSTRLVPLSEALSNPAAYASSPAPASSPSSTAPRAVQLVQAENELEISQIANWYDRDSVTTFRTEAAVMVVDPDIAARRYMAAKFIDLKYRVDYAESGEQALEMIKDHRYNAIFVETALPGIDGYEMCRIIKARPDRRRIAVVFVSSRSSTFDRVKGAMAGCDAYLAKPIDQDKLVATLDKFLPNWRLQLPIV